MPIQPKIDLSSPNDLRQGKDASDTDLDRLAADFRGLTQSIPAKSLPQYVIALVGLVGSGKTTVAQALTQQLAVVRLSNDEARDLLRQRGFNFLHVRELSYRVGYQLMSEGYNLVLDMDCASTKSQKVIAELQREFPRVTVYWVRVTAPEEVILKRLKERNDYDWKREGEGIESTYHYRKTLHQNLPMQFTAEIDTTKEVAEQVEQLVKKIC